MQLQQKANQKDHVQNKSRKTNNIKSIAQKHAAEYLKMTECEGNL